MTNDKRDSILHAITVIAALLYLPFGKFFHIFQRPAQLGKSGRMISLPVVIAIVDGQRYLVSMLGDNVQWVQSVGAAGGRAVLRSGGREEVQLEEVPVDQRAPILRAYLQRAPGARPHVPVNKDVALAEFQRVAATFPIFRLASTSA